MLIIKAVLDDHTCDYCRERDGLEVDIDGFPPFEGCTAGDELDDDGNLIKKKNRCRCIAEVI